MGENLVTIWIELAPAVLVDISRQDSRFLDCVKQAKLRKGRRVSPRRCVCTQATEEKNRSVCYSINSVSMAPSTG